MSELIKEKNEVRNMLLETDERYREIIENIEDGYFEIYS